MSDEPTRREVLFRLGNRDIVKNGLYAIIGPCNNSSRHMVVAYSKETNKSTWVSPMGETFYSDGRGLMAIIKNCADLKDAFNTPKPYLYFPGGAVEFDQEYKPTTEQIAILQNWHRELRNAGIGGAAPDIRTEEIREEFRADFSSQT